MRITIDTKRLQNGKEIIKRNFYDNKYPTMKNNPEYLKAMLLGADELIESMRQVNKTPKVIVEKILENLIYTRYKNALFDDSVKYNSTQICKTAYYNIARPARANSKTIYSGEKAFIQKWKPFVKKEMNNIRVKYFSYKNSKGFIKLKEKYQNSSYKTHKDIDFDRLLKYLFITNKVSTTKKDIAFLDKLIQIITNTNFSSQNNNNTSNMDKDE